MCVVKTRNHISQLCEKLKQDWDRKKFFLKIQVKPKLKPLATSKSVNIDKNILSFIKITLPWWQIMINEKTIKFH